MSDHEEEHPFYGKEILRHREEDVIEEILERYRDSEPTDELKEAVWNDLQMAKYEGRISIPFKVTTRRDIYGKFPECIEVILDTKL